MKTILKFIFVIATIAFCGNVSAQKPIKLAHLNQNDLITAMPEYDSLIVKMQKIQKEIETELELLQVELRKKYDDHANNSKNWTELVRQSREQEIVNLQQRIQVFQESAQQKLEEENNKLLQPILDKVNKAIEAVAKEQAITYVIDARNLLFKSIDSQDILPLVKQQLGVTK